MGETWLITIYCCLNDPGGAYCGATASGVRVFDGAAACDPALTQAATFVKVARRVFQCVDTGSAVHGRHLDVWFYDCGILPNPAEGTGWAWLQRVGDRAIVEVME